MPDPWDNDPIVAPADAPPALRQIVPPQPKTNVPPSGYRPNPSGDGLEYIPGGPADPQTKSQDEKVAVDERTAAGYYRRAVNADRLYGEGILPRNPVAQGLINILPDDWEGYFDSETRKAAKNYADEFIRAKLRKESGASIPPDEMIGEYRVYFPVAGDTKVDLERKARLRKEALEGLRIAAGSQAGEALKGLDTSSTSKVPSGPGDIGFETPDQDPRKNPMTPEQQSAYDAWLKANPQATPEQLRSFVKSIGLPDVSNAEEVIDAFRKTGQFTPGAGALPTPPDISGMRKGDEIADPILRGVADAATLGFSDELAAGANELTGQGDYFDSLAKDRAIAHYDEQNNFWLRTGGQVAGGFATPLFRARTAAELAKAGAIYGGIYGAGSSEHLADVPKNIITGAAIGAAASWGGSKLLQKLGGKSARDIPELVDPATGRLNEPLEEAGPAGRVAAAQQFGIDLPMGAAGDRTAKIVEKGLDNVPGSAGVMNDARRITEGQVADAAEGVADKYGTARTLLEAGDAAQRGAKSWISRFEDTASKAYAAIPISPKAASLLHNTQTALGELTGIFESNPKLAETFKNTRLNTYLDALDPAAGGSLSWKDLQGFRSRIGEEIGEQRFSDSPMKSELRRLYAALSEDMRQTAAAQGPQALRKFERANDLYRDGQQRIDTALSRILGDNSKLNPEAAGAAIQTIARSGRGSGNLQQLAEMRASLAKSGDWNEVASSLIRLGGQPAKSEGRSFSPQTFVNWYSDMTEPARNILFGGSNKELRTALDDFVAVNQRLAGTNALRNTSNTTPSLIGTSTVLGAGAAILNPLLGLKLAGVAAANYGMGRLWTSPKFVRWATGYSKMLAGAAKAGAAPSAAGTAKQVKLLERVAAADPAITQEALGLRNALLGANDNARLAASDDANSEQQDQP